MSLVTTPMLAERIGSTYREIDYWITSGYLSPTPVDGDNRAHGGTGRPRIWAEREAETALWFARLVRLGMKPGAIGDIAESLADGRPAHLPHGITIQRTAVAR